MQAMNCPRCGRLFTAIRAPICPACEKSEEETFQRLKEYIDENPMCTMAELTKDTKVSAKRITQYIRDGRLEISKGMIGTVTCEQCGTPIKRGRYCEGCALKVKQSIGDLFSKSNAPKEPTSNSHRLHTLGKAKTL